MLEEMMQENIEHGNAHEILEIENRPFFIYVIYCFDDVRCYERDHIGLKYIDHKTKQDHENYIYGFFPNELV
jgi:hypothetical protein